MAKENAVKFFEILANDPALAEKLAAADKAYAETHKPLPEDADETMQIAFRNEAAKAIILPVAEEAGLPFTLEELQAYEEDQIHWMDQKLSTDELDQVAGGEAKGAGAMACFLLGIGLGGFAARRRHNINYSVGSYRSLDMEGCIILGLGSGANACMGKGKDKDFNAAK